MKVFQADSFILGTRKLWQTFPIKQKFCIVKMFITLSILVMFLTMVSTYLYTENTVRKSAKFDQIERFELPKKAALLSNFCLIGKIPHNIDFLGKIQTRTFDRSGYF